MRMNFKLTFGALAFLTFTAGVFAQSPNLKVKVEVSRIQSVKNDLLILIAANPNFTLVTDDSDDVLLIANCTEPKVPAFGTPMGAQLPIACAVLVVYDRYRWLNLIYIFDGGPYVTTDYDRDEVARTIYSAFLQATTPDKIASAQAKLADQVVILLSPAKEKQ